MDRGQYMGLVADTASTEACVAPGAPPPRAEVASGTRFRRVVAVAAVLFGAAAVLVLVRPRSHAAGTGAAERDAVGLSSASSAPSADDFLAQAEAQNEANLAKKMGVTVDSLEKGTTAATTSGKEQQADADAARKQQQAVAQNAVVEQQAKVEKATETVHDAVQSATSTAKLAAQEVAQDSLGNSLATATADQQADTEASVAKKAAAAKAEQEKLAEMKLKEIAESRKKAQAAASKAEASVAQELTSTVPKVVMPPMPAALAAASPVPVFGAVLPPAADAASTAAAASATAVAGSEAGAAEDVATSAAPPVVVVPSLPPVEEITTTKLNAGTLAPLESRHDGNVCDVEEEFFGGLCYRKCSLLTSGQRPHRKSPWSCCNNAPCDSLADFAKGTFTNPMKEAQLCLHHCDGEFGSSVLCGGYDVAGDGSCPHTAGACLTDEELHIGMCYKKCTLLTNGVYPFRSGAASCCKEQSELGCVKPGASITNAHFQVGGGDGKDTPASLHMPIGALTEDDSSDMTTTPTPTATEALAPVAEKPVETRHDGNTCEDTEELFEGLCYRRCALLSNGDASIRTSAWTCCEKTPCTPLNSRKAAGFPLGCHGFDISGDGSCPHKPGACYEDEELYLGVCYKSCSSLTGGDFPHRSAPATCCKTQGLGCLLPSNVMLSKDFAVGGGNGDGDAATEALPHPPKQSLTEGTSSAGSATAGADDEVALWKVVATNNVNVRQSPSPDALVISVKKKGANVHGIRQGKWLKLEGEGESGYMMIDFHGMTLLAKDNGASA